jgi:hypothetical protein
VGYLREGVLVEKRDSSAQRGPLLHQIPNANTLAQFRAEPSRCVGCEGLYSTVDVSLEKPEKLQRSAMLSTSRW